MTVREIRKQGNINPIGIKANCNFGGIGILYIDSDIVISGENYGDGWKRINKANIKYNINGDPYFMRYGIREKLSDYMRCD